MPAIKLGRANGGLLHGDPDEAPEQWHNQMSDRKTAQTKAAASPSSVSVICLNCRSPSQSSLSPPRQLESILQQ